ncbi:hypothetical protein BT96DRAFT_943566 [Gymnopus androsaceus JB14]|uniref:F-box domain-containing protein n=1 Tax=Gymnopus androsaceus JB14 TaxID=1447944 RepID=A0A6A4H6W4_9AGAR|nr:hypothetical protein BT96DRAFT_943566 [Gymnopus androsaceus JB14]
MTNLPFDILWKILEYLPFEEVTRIRTVNRHFLEIARTLQYRKLVVNGYGKRTKRLLKALCHWGTMFVRYTSSLGLLITWSQSKLTAGANAIEFSPWLITFIPSSTLTIRDAEPKLWSASASENRSSWSPKQHGNFQFVQEYSIGWDVDRPYHAELFTAFLSLADVAPFGKTLTKLSLKVPTDRLVCLASVRLPSLEELDIHLATQSLSERYINDCLDCFVVFVNNLYLTLRSLSVSTSHTSLNLDLYTFFHLLGDFAHLHTLGITIPYDGAHFSSLDSLRFFIHKHNGNLQELKLLCHARSAARTRPNDPSAKYWIQRIVADISSTPPRDLHKLELALRPLRSQLTPFLTFLASVADQLDSLVLTG